MFLATVVHENFGANARAPEGIAIGAPQARSYGYPPLPGGQEPANTNDK